MCFWKEVGCDSSLGVCFCSPQIKGNSRPRNASIRVLFGKPVTVAYLHGKEEAQGQPHSCATKKSLLPSLAPCSSMKDINGRHHVRVLQERWQLVCLSDHIQPQGNGCTALQPFPHGPHSPSATFLEPQRQVTETNDRSR